MKVQTNKSFRVGSLLNTCFKYETFQTQATKHKHSKNVQYNGEIWMN